MELQQFTNLLIRRLAFAAKVLRDSGSPLGRISMREVADASYTRGFTTCAQVFIMGCVCAACNTMSLQQLGDSIYSVSP